MFSEKITHIANRPPWAQETEINGEKGFWAEVGNKNHPVFLTKNNRIFLPKYLRGKSVSDIRQEDLDNLEKFDSGHTHYQLWKKDNDIKLDNNRIWKTTEFSAFGLVLLERLKRFLAKNKLDDVTNLGLDAKYNIDLNIFDNLMNTTDIHKVQRLGRTIAKKYRIITELLKSKNKLKLTARLDKDFYYNWDKLESFFDFDAAGYKPNDPAEDEPKKTLDQVSELVKIKNDFLNQTQYLIEPQMSGFSKAIKQFDAAVMANDKEKSKRLYQTMATELTRLIAMAPGSGVAQKAEQILHLPQMPELHHLLFGDLN